MFRGAVSHPFDVFAFLLHRIDDMVELLVFRAVNHRAVGLYGVQVGLELIDVILLGGEDVDMVPRNACDDGHMRAVPQELGPQIDGGAEVFVAFDDGPVIRRLEVHHAVESFELGTHHEVRGSPGFFQGMQNHGSDGGFSMASGHHHALFGLCGEAQKLGVTLDPQPELLGLKQFGVVHAGMHSQDDHIDVRGDSLDVPTLCFRKQSCRRQTSSTRLKNLVVASRHHMSGVGQGQGEVVHGASANCNEMNPHD